MAATAIFCPRFGFPVDQLWDREWLICWLIAAIDGLPESLDTVEKLLARLATVMRWPSVANISSVTYADYGDMHARASLTSEYGTVRVGQMVFEHNLYTGHRSYFRSDEVSPTSDTSIRESVRMIMSSGAASAIRVSEHRGDLRVRPEADDSKPLGWRS